MNDISVPVRESCSTTPTTRGPTGLWVEFFYYLSATKRAPVETPVETPWKTSGKTSGKILAHLAANPYAQEIAHASISEGQSRLESRLESRLAGRVLLLLREAEMGKARLAVALGHATVSGELHKQIRRLAASGYISMTMPDKRNSRLQKYRLTQQGLLLIEALHQEAGSQ